MRKLLYEFKPGDIIKCVKKYNVTNCHNSNVGYIDLLSMKKIKIGSIYTLEYIYGYDYFQLVGIREFGFNSDLFIPYSLIKYQNDIRRKKLKKLAK